MGPGSNCLPVECRSSLPNVTSWYETPIAVSASPIRCFSFRMGLPHGSSFGVPSNTPREIPALSVRRSFNRNVFHLAPPLPMAASKSSAKSELSPSSKQDTITIPIGSGNDFRSFVNSFFCSPVNRRGAFSFRNLRTSAWSNRLSRFSCSASLFKRPTSASEILC